MMMRSLVYEGDDASAQQHSALRSHPPLRPLLHPAPLFFLCLKKLRWSQQVEKGLSRQSPDHLQNLSRHWFQSNTCQKFYFFICFCYSLSFSRLRLAVLPPSDTDEAGAFVPLVPPEPPSVRGGLQGRKQQKLISTWWWLTVEGNLYRKTTKLKLLEKNKSGLLPECGYGAEVVVDVEHGGIKQGVDVLETLQSGLQTPPALCLQLPQLLLWQLGQRRRRRRHRRHWRRSVNIYEGSNLTCHHTFSCWTSQVSSSCVSSYGCWCATVIWD